jgi:hypothetical protein
MKTRIALSLASLLLITSAAFAGSPAKAGSPDRDAGQSRVVADGPRNPNVSDRGIKVPFIFDGVEFPAGTKITTSFLTYVLTPEDISKGTIHIFSSPDVAKVFMEQNRPKGTSTDAQGHHAATLDTCDWPQEYSWFNTAVGCGNSGVLTLYPFGAYSNLDFGGWNNTISCVKAACVGYYTVIYSCRNFQMTVDGSCSDPAALLIPSGFIITDLNNYGFNNRTSSIDFE